MDATRRIEQLAGLVVLAAALAFIQSTPLWAGSGHGAGEVQASPYAGPVATLKIGFANGITATLYTAAALADLTTTAGTRGVMRLPDGTCIDVITDTSDPAIANEGDGHFHPYGQDLVAGILAGIDCPGLRAHVEVYALPYPRAGTPSSSTSSNRIFLSPQVGEITAAGAAYIIAHEMGHVFHNLYLPDRAVGRWAAYRRIRGIVDTEKYNDQAAHAFRPKEILAEDFRVLFGGRTASFNGQAENGEVQSPGSVPGLREFMLGLLSDPAHVSAVIDARSLPNPFNPTTVIQIQLSDEFIAGGSDLTVRIYDVRGALVRELYSGRANDVVLRVPWNGRDTHGRSVATGTYFASIVAGKTKEAVKLLLLK